MFDAAANTTSSTTPLLDVRDLSVYWPARRGWLNRGAGVCRAVDGVSFTIAPGTTLGLVGESGCGKSTLARAVLRLIAATSGQVLFDGEDILSISQRRMRTLRRHMQIVFQDPVGSLNPRMTVGRIIAEPLHIHRVGTRRSRNETVARLLLQVGLQPDDAQRFPHQFSGGQRQRIGIARAIALRPRFIIWDEPVSALDVSIQSQILNLLADLKQELGWTGLFIGHNLAVVKHVSDMVAVMYLGQIVEIAPARELFNRPQHPYTQALLSAVLEPGRVRVGSPLSGETPSPLDPPSGCRFHPRCAYATQECRSIQPGLLPDSSSKLHWVACHHPLSVL